MTGHVSAGILASYREGDVSRRRAARISAHLSGCARCAGVNSDLAAVSSVLAGVQLPRMPDHLAARVQGALATEAAARAALSPAQAAGASGSAAVTAGAGGRAQLPGRPDLPERTRRSRRRRMPWLSSPLVLRTLAAAGAVVVLAGGGYLLASGSGSSTSSPAAPAAGTGRSINRPAANGSNPRSSAQVGTYGLPYTRKGILSTALAVHSNLDFRRATLASQVRREIASTKVAFSGSSEQPAPENTAVPRGQFGGASVRSLEACISLLAAGRDVLLVDVARYEGSPATVIVTANSPAARTLFVWVVGLACSGSHSDVIADVTIPAG